MELAGYLTKAMPEGARFPRARQVSTGAGEKRPLGTGTRTLCACMLFLGINTHVFGDDDRLTFRGFGTLGLTYNPSDEFSFIRDMGQEKGARDEVSARVDSILGLQMNYDFNSDWEAVVQVMSRNNDDGSLAPELTWAFLKYQPNPTWEFRAGRLGWDLLSRNRNVGYAFTWMRPPMEFFGSEQLKHLDGVDVVAKYSTDRGLFWVKLYGGYADESRPFGNDIELDLSGTQVLGGSANYSVGDWQFRLGVSERKLKHGIPEMEPFYEFLRNANPTAARLADDMSMAGKKVRHHVAGAIYQRGPFQAQMMVDHGKSESLLLSDFNAGYAMMSYRLDQWTPYLSYAAVKGERVTRASGFPPGSPPDQGIQWFLDASRWEQNTLSLGIRYDFHQNMAFKFQVDRISAESPFVSLVRNPDFEWDGDGTIFGATVDFVF